MKLTEFKIATRLGVSFALILALSFLATGTAMWQQHTTSDRTNSMMDKPLAKERYIADWYRYVFAAVRRTEAIAKSTDPQLGPFFASDIEVTSKGASEAQKAVEQLLMSNSVQYLPPVSVQIFPLYQLVQNDFCCA